MGSPADPPTPSGRSIAIAGAAAVLLTLAMTWPLAAGFGRLGRTQPGDGLYAIWNVAWVAHALTTRPFEVLDANIFHPSRRTLAFSEMNLVAGTVAIPGWLATRNPYVAHNSALVLAFATSALGAWLLAARVTGHAGAAAFAAVLFAFTPFFFAHTAHIQLLFAGGIPLSLLFLYRLIEAPSLRRGLALGGALAIQALACAYYGIYAGLLVGYGAIVLGISRRRLLDRQYLTALAVAASSSILLVLPFFMPFVSLQQDAGFRRPLEESIRYSANLHSYLASGAHAHRTLLDAASMAPRFTEVLFPGFLALAFAILGVASGWMRRMPSAVSPMPRNTRESVLLFGSIGVIACWASFGPAGGLYSVLYRTMPLFSFLRAPSRLGPVVVLALSMLAGLGAAWLIARVPRPSRAWAAALLVCAALLELTQVPFRWERAPQVPSPYRLLAQLPRAPVAEFPFYGARHIYHLHTRHMLFSTAHWFPLVNGYSDYFPPDFREAATVLDGFPSDEGFAVLRRRRVRYVTVHWGMYGHRRAEIEERLRPYGPYLRRLAADETMTLYEVVTYP